MPNPNMFGDEYCQPDERPKCDHPFTPCPDDADIKVFVRIEVSGRSVAECGKFFDSRCYDAHNFFNRIAYTCFSQIDKGEN